MRRRVSLSLMAAESVAPMVRRTFSGSKPAAFKTLRSVVSCGGLL
jgi:hypothetical protein